MPAVYYRDAHDELKEWRGPAARPKYEEAFSEEFRWPEQMRSYARAPEPYNGSRPIAIIDWEGTRISVKVITHPAGAKMFLRQFPHSDPHMVFVVVSYDDTAEDIRKRTFEGIENKIAELRNEEAR